MVLTLDMQCKAFGPFGAFQALKPSMPNGCFQQAPNLSLLATFLHEVLLGLTDQIGLRSGVFVHPRAIANDAAPFQD